MPTTPLGLTYPLSSEHTRLWEHLQNLAESADDAISLLVKRLGLVIATGSAVLSGSGASSYSAPFTWDYADPGTSFTADPICAISNVGGTGSSAFYLMLSTPPTSAGGTFLAVNRDGAVLSLTSLTAHVIGVQLA